MKIDNLNLLDQSFEVHHNSDPLFEIDTISDTFLVKNSSIIFIKNKKFMAAFLSRAFDAAKFGFVLDKKYFITLSNDEIDNLKKISVFISSVDDVNIAMSKMSKTFYDLAYPVRNNFVDGRQMGTVNIHPTAFIAQNVFLGENIKIHANVIIHAGCVLMSDVEIEEGSIVFPNTTFYRNVKIGKNVRIHSGCTFGADGFGYNFHENEHLKIWHFGGVLINDNVEIGANCTVDSGTFSPTIIDEGTKLDNMVQVGHNCRVGKRVIVCGNVALAGSCVLHDYVVIGGKSAVGNAVVLGVGAQVAAFSGVINDVKPKEVVGGFPAREYKEWMKGLAMLRKISLTKNKEP